MGAGEERVVAVERDDADLALDLGIVEGYSHILDEPIEGLRIPPNAIALGRRMQILVRYRVPATWVFLRVNRAQMTLDTSLHALYPQMDYFKVMRTYNRKAATRRAKALLRRDGAAREAAALLFDLPKLVRGTIEENTFNVKWVRRRARNFQATANRATMIGRAISTVLTSCVLLAVAGVVMLFSHQHGQWLPLTDEMAEWLNQVPRLPAEIWIGAGALGGMILLSGWRGRRALAQLDIGPSKT